MSDDINVEVLNTSADISVTDVLINASITDEPINASFVEEVLFVTSSKATELNVEINSYGESVNGGECMVNIPSDIIKNYITHDFDKATDPIFYIGKLTNSGNWLFIKMDKTTQLDLTYANLSNNNTITSYSDAYANRASLTYENLDQISFTGTGDQGFSSCKMAAESSLTGSEEYLKSIDGALQVIETSLDTKPIDSYLLRVVGTPKFMAADTTIGSYTIEMSSGHGFSTGDELLVAQNGNDVKSFNCKILNVATNTLTVDSPFDTIYTSSGAIVLQTTKDLNVDGSTTAVKFDLPNSTNTEFHITRIIIHITDADEMDDSKFGSLTALSRGIVFRKKNSDGTYNNIFNVKNNGEFGELAYDLTYQDAVKHGTYGLHCRLTYGGIGKHGTVFKIKQGEAIEVLIQDDLTDLDSFRIMVQGHFGLEPLE